MTLSEAIRFGAMMRPLQAFNTYFKLDASCALGAAADACGYVSNPDDDHSNLVSFLMKHLTIPDVPTLKCPQGCTYTNGQPSESSLAPMVGSLAPMVVHLNDTHYWSRGEIADWVATLEAAEASKQPAEPEIAEMVLQ